MEYFTVLYNENSEATSSDRINQNIAVLIEHVAIG